MPDIAKWLSEVGLAKYVSAFADAEVDFQTLPDLVEDDLKGCCQTDSNQSQFPPDYRIARIGTGQPDPTV